MQRKAIAFFKKNARLLLSTLGIFFLFLAYNHTLVFNPSTALTDWLDYPLIVFILEQNISHFSQLDFANYANISSFYPSPGGMFFTETLFVQGIIGTLVFPFTKNYILTHNIIFFLTALTNIISLHYFWSRIFKNQLIVSVLTLLFIFSPYYFSTYVHFQMIGYAFFFFSAGKIVSAQHARDFLFAGILSGLQFLVGVYLGIYSLTFTGICLLSRLLKDKKLNQILISGGIFTIGFLLIAGFFAYKYAAVKHEYQIVRDAGFYVDLAMQPTDFLFNPYDSVWSRTVYQPINELGHRRGPHYSPGWVLFFVSLAGVILSLKQKRKKILLCMSLLLVWGMIAALGPRLTVNGTYYGTLLPYAVVLKFTPFFEALRATGRWFFIIQIALLFFVGITLEKLLQTVSLKKALPLVLLGIFLYALEVVPLTQRTSVETYRSTSYSVLEENCQTGDVLLEYPFGILGPDVDVGKTLNYWVKMLLNQMYHNCYLVNGYSGFDPEHFVVYRDMFETAVWAENAERIFDLLEQKNVRFIKLNKAYVLPETPPILETLFAKENFLVLFEDDSYLVVQKRP